MYICIYLLLWLVFSPLFIIHRRRYSQTKRATKSGVASDKKATTDSLRSKVTCRYESKQQNHNYMHAATIFQTSRPNTNVCDDTEKPIMNIE